MTLLATLLNSPSQFNAAGVWHPNNLNASLLCYVEIISVAEPPGFRQDGAPAHSTFDMGRYLNTVLPQYLIGMASLLAWLKVHQS